MNGRSEISLVTFEIAQLHTPMRSVTIFRSFFFTLLVAAMSFGQALAQEAPRRTTTPPSTTKDGSAPARIPGPGVPIPVPVPNPNPDNSGKAPVPTTQPAPVPTRNPEPVYRPAPRQDQSTTIDHNYDVNGDGVISKEERKRMKEIRKAERKRQHELRKAERARERELRKSEHEDEIDELKREKAAQGLEARQEHLKGHGHGNNGKGHGKGKNK